MREWTKEIKLMIESAPLEKIRKIGNHSSRRFIQKLEKLPGDASTRHYYRAFSEQQSYVVMITEPFEDQGQNLPFLWVQRLLKDYAIRVPEVHGIDAKEGYILLEDLGDVTFLKKLQGISNPESEFLLFKKAIETLVILHQIQSPDNCPTDQDPKSPSSQTAFDLQFDFTKLMWEVEFTWEHFFIRYLQRNIQPEHKRIFQEQLGEICKILAEEPKVLTHRDFHSRNLMLKNDDLFLLDFQDARMGPRQYDLVSLLKDSYYQLEETQIRRLTDYYISKVNQGTETKTDFEKFQTIFDLMAVQRNLKAIGSFSSFYNLKSNSQYLKFIGNTFENIRRTLLKYPQYSDLREVLFHYYYF